VLQLFQICPLTEFISFFVPSVAGHCRVECVLGCPAAVWSSLIVIVVAVSSWNSLLSLRVDLLDLLLFLLMRGPLRSLVIAVAGIACVGLQSLCVDPFAVQILWIVITVSSRLELMRVPVAGPFRGSGSVFTRIASLGLLKLLWMLVVGP
jgi:hypothetical protein